MWVKMEVLEVEQSGKFRKLCNVTVVQHLCTIVPYHKTNISKIYADIYSHISPRPFSGQTV